jgi:hypothetical protein
LKGLKNRGESKTYYVAPNSGKLTLSSKTEREGYVRKEFVDSNGKITVKYVMEFDQLTVKLKDAKVESTDYGKRWAVKGVADDEVYFLQFKYSSGYSKSFFKQLEMVDLSKPVTITASYKEEEYDGRTVKNSALWIAQDGKWVGFKYTKDNPGDLPAEELITVKGEEVKDDTKMLAYFETVATQIFNELKLKEDQQDAEDFMTSEIDGSEVQIPAGAAAASPQVLEDDDLPF